MTVTLLDSDAAMRRILSLPLAERDAAARDMLDPMAGMYRYFPGAVDVVEMHHLGSGFRIDVDDERLTTCGRGSPALSSMASLCNSRRHPTSACPTSPSSSCSATRMTTTSWT
jgi:hypothetical protein